jgi:hypothetical protein
MADRNSNIKNDGDSKEKWNKQDNENCFLPNCQKISYDSIIILEMFSIEEFDDLFDGLDKLYSNIHYFERNRLNYRKILHDGERTSLRGTMYLPPIMNTKIKDKHRFVAFQDLGDTIDSITITLHATLPSFINLQIQASLDSNISDKINGVIYKYHDEVQEKTTTPSGEFTTHYQPEHLKNKEINEIKNNLKNQVIKFLSVYFEGVFFKHANKHISYVPSIDLFSLSYPDKTDEIGKWLSNNNGFFHCFNILFLPRTAYKYKALLIKHRDFFISVFH